MDYSFYQNNLLHSSSKVPFRRRCSTLNRCPDRFLCNYGSVELPNMTQWVSCRFSCNEKQEYLMALGDEEGFVTLADSRHSFDSEAFMAKSWTFQADTSVIMGSHFVPQRDGYLITISGSSAVKIWDLETQRAISCIGHEMSVRALSVMPDNPFCIITGARDGMVLAWDSRESFANMNGNRSDSAAPVKCYPYRKYAGAHLDCPVMSTPKEPKHKRSRLSLSSAKNCSVTSSPLKAAKKMATITAVLAADDKYFLSASSSSQSGIRLWDMRYQQCSKPLRIFEVPKRLSKDCGMTSMCWDRFSSKFYATCTDNSIYEYALWSKSCLPMKTYSGATINSFYVQCAASPISDHLVCGSSNDYALVWDLEEDRRYIQDESFGINFLRSPNKYLPNPKFKLEGHRNEVFTVCWSCNGRYLVTMDESWLRVWDSNAPSKSDRCLRVEFPKRL